MKKKNDEDKEILNILDHPQPNKLLDSDPDEINIIYKMVDNDTREMGNKVGAFKRTKNKSEEQKMELELYKMQHETKKI